MVERPEFASLPEAISSTSRCCSLVITDDSERSYQRSSAKVHFSLRVRTPQCLPLNLFRMHSRSLMRRHVAKGYHAINHTARRSRPFLFSLSFDSHSVSSGVHRTEWKSLIFTIRLVGPFCIREWRIHMPSSKNRSYFHREQHCHAVGILVPSSVALPSYSCCSISFYGITTLQVNPKFLLHGPHTNSHPDVSVFCVLSE